MAQNWHSVNELGFSALKQGDTKNKSEQRRYAPQEEHSPPSQKEDTTIVLQKATWVPGSEGFQFNKKCQAKVKVYLGGKVPTKKLQLQFFVVYKGIEENLQADTEVLIGDDGIASADITLFYGENYYKDYSKNRSLTCEYKFIASYNNGQKKIESNLLKMPAKPCITIVIVDTDGKPLNNVAVTIHSSDVFMTDSEGTIVIEQDAKYGGETVEITKIELPQSSS
ncbi:MAG: hypothetical protein JW795_16885 [Chitinivibrionales bacterium]|nr:hypothetical protein [Chitinivibrionales bacterium]